MMDRVKKLLALCEGKAGAVLLHKPENIRYFSGFTGEGMLVLSGHGCAVITDFRYTEQAAQQTHGFDIRQTSRDLPHNRVIANVLSDLGIKHVLFEADFITVTGYQALNKVLEGITLSPIDGMPEKVRRIKSIDEISAIRKAAALTDQTFDYMLSIIHPGMSEIDVRTEMEYYFAKHSASSAFDPIIASGENGSMPHAIPTERKLRAGDFITMDFGSLLDGYCSDFTRTISLGSVSDELEHIYAITLEAQKAALAATKPGVTGGDVDAVARRIITDAGYGDRFGHGTGHGLGLLVHEAPGLGRGSEDVLETGMVVTIEPGIYLPGVGGVRIEDLCLVTDTGTEVLSRSSKERITLPV